MKNSKRLMAGLLALLTVITSVFTGSSTSMAASSSAKLQMWYASSKEHGVVTEFNSYTYTGNIMYAMIDGATAYCMNYAKSADGSQTMNSSSTPKTALSATQEKQLGYCMYYGHGKTNVAAPTTAERNGYIATQAMVWIIEKGLFGTAQADSAAQKICACAPNSTEAYNFYVSLRNNMQAAMNVTIPSFASTTKSGAPTYELKWNEANKRFETTLSDTNGALSSFNFSVSGFKTSKNGNQLTIYSDTVNTTATVVTGATNNGTVQPTSSCVYWTINKEKYQEFVSTKPQVDPISAYLKVKTESIGYGHLTKTDEATGAVLPNAVFGIYSDSACNNLVSKFTTGADGTVKSQELVAGTYYVKEITAPKGYVLSKDVHTMVVRAGQTTYLNVVDKEQEGALSIFKEGEVLTKWDGNNFVYEMRNLPGATFKVTAGADIYRADGTKVHSEGDVIAEQLTTGTDGHVYLGNLHLGTYVVTETSSIDGYTINTTPQVVKIEYENQNISVQVEAATIRNARQKAEVVVTKKDSDTENPLAGGQYTLYATDDIVNYAGEIIVSKGKALQTVTTDKSGKATFTLDLPIANGYYVSETLAPEGYVRNSEDVYKFGFNYLLETEEKATFKHTFFNDRVTAKVKISKVDADTKTAVPQGDASLKGAEYGVYARNDILHPDGTTDVVFKANDLVATVITDAKGKAQVSNLYLGNYYVKEIAPSEGYLLDEKEYDLVCNYEGDLVAEVTRSTVSEEVVMRQPFQLIKVSDDGEETNAPLLKGAGFTAYLKSAIPLKKDGSYDFKKATPVVIGYNGETELFSDEAGFIITKAIPYGTYVIVESTTPHNMETVKPFEITISKNAPKEPQVWRVLIDREFTAKLRIVKMDADTGKTVLRPNAEFKIYDMNRKEYVTMITTYPSKVTHTSFFTDADGDLILPDVLKLGNYRIEEVAAPHGYVVNKNHVTVAVDTDTFYEIDPETNEAIITVAYENEPTVGKLTVKKRGELLDAFKGGLFASSDKKEFVYVEGNLAGAKFEVYANEDIYTADMQLDVNGERTKYYSKDELVATIVTDKNGVATLKDLPLGSYRVVEVEAPYGYVLDSEEQVVTFVYVDDKTPVIEESVTFGNDRQKLEISLDKKDSENGNGIGGAVFGLYAGRDIVNAEGKVIVEAGTLLEKAVSDEHGHVLFVKDYPFSNYYVKEIQSPKGYVSSDETVIFETEYKGQDVEVASYNSVFLNVPTTFEFTKTDITSGAELTGATLTVFDSHMNVIDTWTSKAGEAHVIKRLVVGETYTLREEFAPYGYLKATDIQFTVEDTEKVQTVNMKDEVPTGTIIINKDGEFLTDVTLVKDHWYDFIFTYFRDSLAGVTFEVYAGEDIVSPDGLETVLYQKDELVSTIVTNDKGIAMVENLPLGEYYLVETKTLDGFVLDSEPIKAELFYIDQETPVVHAGMSITNERQKVEIIVVKKDAETDAFLEGAVFGLYAKNDIVNRKGDVLIVADTLIERAVTDKDGTLKFVSDLPLGQYYVKEVEAPKGYVKSEDVYEINATSKDSSVAVLEFEAEFKNFSTKIDISKTEITGEHELVGATLTILDMHGNVIDTWVSDGTEHRIERIPVGKYILREEIAPYGYKIATDIEFEVKETAEVQKVTMVDEIVKGKLVIVKTDEKTGKGIEGVEFEIRDAQGNVIETLVTDKDGHAESKELAIGIYENGAYKEDMKYYVVETKAAQGYIPDETVREVVFCYDDKEAPEIVLHELSVTNKPIIPEGPKTGDDSNPFLFAGIAVAGLGLAVLALLRKKKEDK